MGVMEQQFTELMIQHGHLGVFLALMIIGLGLPIPEDIILITGGWISAQDNSPLWMSMVGILGVMCGDSIIYWLGYHYGETILSRRPFIWLVSADRLTKVRTYYRKYGYWTIFISRFAAGLRATSFLMAGTSHVPYRIFFLANGSAALFSVPFFVYLGYHFADRFSEIIAYVKVVKTDLAIVLGILLVLYLAYRLIKHRMNLSRTSQAASMTSALPEPPSKAGLESHATPALKSEQSNPT